MRLSHWLVLALAAALSGCAQMLAGPKTTGPKIDKDSVAVERERQHELYRLQYIDEYRRVTRVGWPILVANADLCAKRGEAGLRLPFDIGSTAWIEREDKRVAPRLGVGDDAMVVAAFEPTARNGVRDGDIILAVNGTPAPRGAKAARDGEQLILATSGVSANPVALQVRRGDEVVEALVRPRYACVYPVDIEDKTTVNANANGKRVMVLTGLVRYFRSDDDLAVVLGHEVAHNVRGHIEAKRKNILIGRLLSGGVVGTPAQQAAALQQNDRYWAQVNGVAFEKEADYVGLYLTARAGYPIDDAPNLFRRLPIASPAVLDRATTHPTSPERFVVLQATVLEIKRKQAAGQPLLPEEH